jgi:hypothetical protein
LDYKQFYRDLFTPLEATLGPISDGALTPIVGFDAGGPLSFCVFERELAGARTYVSCELAARTEQTPSEFGRYELLATSDDEDWVTATLSDIGRESFDVQFGDGHTLDIGAWVPTDAAVQGIVFEAASSSQIDGVHYDVLRCIGVTRPELEYARGVGVPDLLNALRTAGIYPRTITTRDSVREAAQQAVEADGRTSS